MSSTPGLNPFDALDNVQDRYKSYVETFQDVDDDTIGSWIQNRIENGAVLWKEPYIQLNQRFEQGRSLESFVEDGDLHKGVLDVFTGDDGQPIEPYEHQSEAVENILERGNTIVSTGTGSGKSFAFGIPIVSHCLKARQRGEEGVKAVIIYPMNALANSQYEDFAERLDGTGLRLGLYTGDTPTSPNEEMEFLRQFGRKESYDSEVMSREEMQENPPDILMTNYVMLDLILTRHEDKKLFPDSHEGVLQYLVLDEVHTYTGQQGADVAALIRRLKQHTGATDELTCIGTSATVQSAEGLDADEEISSFAEKIFGEGIEPDDVVRESHYSLPLTGEEKLPREVQVTKDDIRGFDGSFESAVELTEKVLDRELIQAEKNSRSTLGDVLTNHPTVKFLDRELSRRSQQISSSTEEREDLIQTYQEELRPEATEEEIECELRATLLAGIVGTTDIQGEQEPVFIPKLHTFFSQGSGLVACITEESFEDTPPHLSDAGDIECRRCMDEYDRARSAYPLSFCRSCGQEFYTVAVDENKNLSQREVSSIEFHEEEEKRAVYLLRGDWDEETVPLPEEWTKDGSLRDNYTEARPRPVTYCPEHDQITKGKHTEGRLDCGCFAQQGIHLTLVEAPFLFCPNCGVHHTRRVRSEFNKLFTFGTVGRSTATDILVGNTMDELPEEQRKTIAFSDNRQDTALQAAHMNNLYQRIRFRRSVYQALDPKDSIVLTDIGDKAFDALEDHEMLPDAIDSGMFGPSGDDRKRYSDYLLFNSILELGRGQKLAQQTLEDVGLIEVEYENLDKLAEAEEVWEDVPVLSEASADVRQEYLQGFLDIFRRNNSIDHESTLKFPDFRRKTINKLDEAVQFHGEEYFNFPVGYSDTANTDGPNRVRRLTHPRSGHTVWTKRTFDISSTDLSEEVINDVVSIISDDSIIKLLTEHSLKYTGSVYMLNSGAVRVKRSNPDEVRACPKCGTTTSREELEVCLNYSCGSIEPEESNLEESYFFDLYTQDLEEAVDISAAEHSGQIEGDERKKLESNFREGEEINTIVCTPTMELGIDIGDLSNVYMRNVPPNPSNYAQRSGRAGRQNQPSLITTFCGRGFGKGSHDQYFYQYPEKIISGEISPPTFLLDNEELVRSHINSLVLEVIDHKLQGEIEKFLNIEPEDDDYHIYPDYKDTLSTEIEDNREEIIYTAKQTFKKELESGDGFDWLTEEIIENQVDGFVESFDDAFDPWRREYRQLYREQRRLNKQMASKGGSHQQKRRLGSIIDRLEDMRSGGRDFYTYQYLRSQGFLPNYGFPRSSTTLTFSSREDDIRREQDRAIREFAPGNYVYYAGEKFTVKEARPRTSDVGPLTKHMRVCSECEAVFMGEEAQEMGACTECGNSFEGTHSEPNAMELPNQRAVPDEYITSDEEERRRRGYEIDRYYHREDADAYELESDNINAHLTYEPNSDIVVVNSGFKDPDKDLDGFAICDECNQWLTSEDMIDKHTGEDANCYANASQDQVKRGVKLYTRGGHDTVTLTTPVPDDVDSERAEGFYVTLKEALFQGMLVAFDMDEEEIETFVKPASEGSGAVSIVFYEVSEGGAGALHTLPETARLRQVVREALTVIHEDTGEEGCNKACYECLMSFYNQYEHQLLDRNLVKNWLESMMGVEIEEVEDTKDRDKYESLLEQCDSGFEEDVLEEVWDGGYELPDEAQHTIYDDGEPVAKPDFFYKTSGSSVAIFVDGPDHEKDYIEKDDEEKRKRLRSMGYRVVVVEEVSEVSEIWDTI